DRERETRQHRLAVEQHGARAALAEFAAVLGAGELQVFAQHFEQRLVPVDERVHALAVHGETESRLLGCHGQSASMPLTRNRAMTSPTRCASDGPSGRNQVAVQLSAPSIARVTTASSSATKVPLAIPSATSLRTARS